MTQIDDVQAPCSGSLLVSIMKSGTHMTLKLYARAGYLAVGHGSIDSSDHRVPTEELKRNLLRHPPVAAILDRFPDLEPDVVFSLLAQHAQSEIIWPRGSVEPALQEVWGEVRKLSGRDLFVPGLVISSHLLPWQSARAGFLPGWAKTGAPRIVYNYRDPRAHLVSMINFLVGSSVVDEHPSVQVYRPILRSLGSMDRMLSFAISDRTFPMRNAYEQNRWMLYHPSVLNLRFEDLVGEEGGGSRASQEAAVERWARFLAIEVPVEELTKGLFGDTKTFHKGRVDSWRDAFQEHHLRAFEREFGDVLADYGYADA